ncbi:hypothetical protein VTK56DRAFT_6465 [Thermocarpiscus australiensis]
MFKVALKDRLFTRRAVMSASVLCTVVHTGVAKEWGFPEPPLDLELGCLGTEVVSCLTGSLSPSQSVRPRGYMLCLLSTHHLPRRGPKYSIRCGLVPEPSCDRCAAVEPSAHKVTRL